ncbi:hypothetical protein MO973_25500 [Paenibacillus sp. TRM 82003]|nr:hypothetical protein [Paenibacillus sp. TRM 82003]
MTKLLESEAYGEAVRLLEFLVDCKTDDGRANEEWRTLRDWLKSEFPRAAERTDNEAEDGEPQGEEDLLRRSVNEKTAHDKQYVNRLLASLSQATSDKQLLALDQLAYIDDESIVPELLKRLHDAQLHPFVSFKLLQTLARLGATGEATFARLGEIVTVELERTPLSSDRFPEPLPLVSERVHQVAEVDDPTVSYFAKQTWDEFLSYAYGTALYRDMLGMGDQELDIWASALHAAVAQAMYGSAEAEQLKDRYGITELLLPRWDRAYGALSRFFRDSAGLRV